MYTVSVEEARDLLQKGAVVVDVREEGEFAQARIEGTVNLPLSSFSAAEAHRLWAQGPKDQPLVLLCLGGVRSARALACLDGSFPAFNMTGGLNAWRAARFPVVESNRAPGLLGRLFGA